MFEINRDWHRSNSYDGQIILLDGISGTGKTMLMRILDCLTGLIPARFNYQIEQICIAIIEEKIEPKAGLEILQLIIDQTHYDSSLSREMNFRPTDLSSILKSRKRIEYIKRLMLPDGQAGEERLLLKKEKQVFVVHQLMKASLVLNDLPGKAITRILCVRHPYYLFDHWVSYVDMFGTSARDFTVTLNRDAEIPWFIRANYEMFFDETRQNKAAVVISELSARQFDYIDTDSSALLVDFERFVLNPEVYLTKLENEIGGSFTGLKRVLVRENLPREHINSSNQKAIYKRYSSNLLSTTLGHKADYENLRKRICESTSQNHFALLEEAADKYESKFGLWY